MHVCPMFDGPKPHVGGPVSGPGSANVMIGGMPAATVGDMCVCTGPPDAIIKGSTSVLIGGKPAARMGDQTAHGGMIVAGCPTVLIGTGSGGGGGAGGGANNQFGKETAQQLKQEHNSNSLTDSANNDASNAARTTKDDYSAQYTLRNHALEPIPGVNYEVKMSDGTIHNGKTDTAGKTVPVQGYTVGDGIILFEEKSN